MKIDLFSHDLKHGHWLAKPKKKMSRERKHALLARIKAKRKHHHRMSLETAPAPEVETPPVAKPLSVDKPTKTAEDAPKPTAARKDFVADLRRSESERRKMESRNRKDAEKRAILVRNASVVAMARRGESLTDSIIEMSAPHAPKHGIAIAGKFFAGGEFIPGRYIRYASPQQLKQLQYKPHENALIEKQFDPTKQFDKSHIYGRGLYRKIKRQRGQGREISLTEDEAWLILERGSVGFVSAGRNPNDERDKRLNDSKIRKRYARLRQDLVRSGLMFAPVVGKYGEVEDSFMVMCPEIRRDELVAIGRKYRQDSVLFSAAGKNEFIYTTGPNKGKKYIGTGWGRHDDAEDLYTEIKFPNGKMMRFALDLDFSKLMALLMSSRLQFSCLAAPQPTSHEMRNEQSMTDKDAAANQKHDFASTHVELADEIAADILKLGNSIPNADVGPEGRETIPHVTVKYGLVCDDPLDVAKLLDDVGSIEMTFGGTALFKGTDADVLIVEVRSPDLEKINAKLKKHLPCVDTHPTYRPHATVAYLLPDRGDKYLGRSDLRGRKVVANSIVFNDRLGNQTVIRLGRKPPALRPDGKPIEMAIRHAPKGGVTLAGTFFRWREVHPGGVRREGEQGGAGAAPEREHGAAPARPRRTSGKRRSGQGADLFDA